MFAYKIKGTGLLIRSLILITIFFTGCGIPQFSYIEPPTTNEVTEVENTSYEVVFYNSEYNNSDIFQGYKLYYKFYTETEYESSFQSEIDAIDGQSDFDSYDYYLVYEGLNIDGSVDTSEHLLPVDSSDKDDSFSVTVDFRDDISDDGTNTNFNSFVEYNDEIVYLARNVSQNRDSDSDSSTYSTDQMARSFSLSNGFFGDDVDIPASFVESSLEPLYMTLYVVAYGAELSTPTVIYSEPVYLGFFTLNNIILN